jgi:hypothetical protein
LVQIDCLTNQDEATTVAATTTEEPTTTTTEAPTTTVDPSCCSAVDFTMGADTITLYLSDDSQFVSDSHHMVSLNTGSQDHWVLMKNWHPIFSPTGIEVACFGVDEATCPSGVTQWQCNNGSMGQVTCADTP